MDNVRPGLDLQYFNDICPDKNGVSNYNFMHLWTGLDLRKFPTFPVPVIAVFTKYDQFRANMRMVLEDQDRDPSFLNAEAERVFSGHYLARLMRSAPFVRLESEDFYDHRDMYSTKLSPTEMNELGQQCNGLIEITANALSDSVVALMLLAVQRDCNLELSINYAIRR
jgi:hypothetical protein